MGTHFKVRTLRTEPVWNNIPDAWDAFQAARRFYGFIIWEHNNFRDFHLGGERRLEFEASQRHRDTQQYRQFTHDYEAKYAHTITSTRYPRVSFVERTNSEFKDTHLCKKLLKGFKEALTDDRYVQKTPIISRRERMVHGQRLIILYVAGVHTEKGSILKLITMAKKRAVIASKKPKSTVKHVGIEIEFLSNADKEELGDSLIEAGLEQYVQLKDDGSVTGSDEDAECDCDHGGHDCSCGDCHTSECATSGSGLIGHELCILATQREFAGIVRRVCSVLAEHDAQVNKTCGLHVHLDMRSRDKARGFNNLVLSLSVLSDMVPEQRRDNKYCAPNETPHIQEHLDNYGDRRYFAVNPDAFRTHKTLEVRLHSGTTNADKIINWTKLLIRIVEAKAFSGEVTTLTELNRKLKLPAKLRGYIQTRIKKFKKYVSQLSERAA